MKVQRCCGHAVSRIGNPRCQIWSQSTFCPTHAYQADYADIRFMIEEDFIFYKSGETFLTLRNYVNGFQSTIELDLPWNWILILEKYDNQNF